MKRVLMASAISALALGGMAQSADRIPAKGYALFQADGELKPYDFTRHTVGEKDILMETLYCGVCHSDIHQGHGDWSQQTYPLVTGHEIEGRVSCPEKRLTHKRENMGNNPKGETDLLTAVLTLRKKGFTYRAISAKTGVSSTTVFRLVRNFAPENREPMRSKPYKGRRIAGVRAPERRAEHEPSAPASAEAETLEEKVRSLERELDRAVDHLHQHICVSVMRRYFQSLVNGHHEYGAAFVLRDDFLGYCAVGVSHFVFESKHIVNELIYRNNAPTARRFTRP